MHVASLLVALALLFMSALASQQKEFLTLCAAGDTDGLKALVAATPKANDRRALLSTSSPEQESCLHLLGISGDSAALSYILSLLKMHSLNDEWLAER